MASFNVDPAELQKLLTGNNGPIWRYVQRVGEEVKNQAQRNLSPGGKTAAFNTGTLRSSITVSVRNVNGLPTARVGTAIKYAIFVHEGTGKSTGGFIYPKRSKYLRFPRINNSGRGRRRYRGGQTEAYIYARRVRGVPSRPFLRLALEEVVGRRGGTVR